MKTILLLSVLLSASLSVAQDVNHKFLDKGNSFRIAALAVAASADGYTTQRAIGNGSREQNPIARPLVMQGTAGQAAASLIGVSSAIGVAYLLHKRGFHKMEHIMLDLSAAGEAGLAINNRRTSR